MPLVNKLTNQVALHGQGWRQVVPMYILHMQPRKFLFEEMVPQLHAASGSTPQTQRIYEAIEGFNTRNLQSYFRKRNP